MFLRRRASPVTRRGVSRYGIGILAVAIAFLVQFFVDPLMGPQFPYVTFFFATVLTAWVAGWAPAFVALVSGYLVATFVFLEPLSSLSIEGRDNLIGALLYALIGGTIATLIESQRSMSNELRAANARLQRTVERLRETALSRRELAAIVQHSDDAIIGKQLDGTITTWNRGAERIYGYRAEEAIGKNISILCPPDRLDEVKLLLEQLSRGETVQNIQTTRVRRDGVRIDVAVTISPIRDNRGKIRGASAIARDITALKRAEEMLHKRNRQLAESDRRKDEFLAMLAHELRNPLAPILSATEILRCKAEVERTPDAALPVIQRQVRQMARLLDDLLDVSRISRGRIQLRKVLVNIGEIVERAVETCTPTMKSHGHELAIVVPPQPLMLLADADRLEQILVNLLNNAAKYTEPPGHVWLSAERAGDQVLVRVRDDGIGISPDMLPTVFDLFSQSARSLNRSEGGLGLGLALVRGLVEMHKGSVDVHSDGLDCGTEFIVRLPLPSETPLPSRVRDADVDRLSPSTGSFGQHGSGCRILVVDDNEDAVEMMRELLELEGHQVHVSPDGEAGLSVAQAVDPDVILLDIGLPGLDGYEVARRLRQLPALKQTLLVATTGYGNEADIRRSSEAGFDHHLVKPINLADLRRIVNSTCSADFAPGLARGARI